MGKLAIRGGMPLRSKPWPTWPVFDKREIDAVGEVVRSGKWGHVSAPEAKTVAFENEFSAYHGVNYAICVTNGSVALEVPLRAAGIGYGDEVITPPTTWVATNQAAVLVGADPVFVDVDPDTYCLDPRKIEDAITSRTRAIIVVHLGGYLGDMDTIMAIARKRNLVVIEDCAQAHGSRLGGRLVGTFGDFGAFSFEKTKLMTSGEGGAVITNRHDWGNYAFSFANASMAYGQKGRFSGKIEGWNARMTEFQAVILSVQLLRLEEHRRKRAENAEYLRARLSQIEGISPLRQDPGQNYFSYIFKYDSRCFKDVSVWKFREAFLAEGMPCFSSASHQYPVYRSPVFRSPRRDYANVFCPVAERAFEQEAVGLRATFALLGEKSEMDDIVEAVLKIKENIEELRG